MVLANLNRAQDTPITTLKLASITPRDWPTLPAANAPAKFVPSYVRTITYHGGQSGDDVFQSSANSTESYSPRTQGQKAGLLGVGLAVDVTTPRGWIDPAEPYSATPAAPVLTSISPTTGVHGAAAMEVTLTGSGFTPASAVYTGGVLTPFYSYVSPTEMKVTIDLPNSVAGIIDVKVLDHGLTSVNRQYTIT